MANDTSKLTINNNSYDIKDSTARSQLKRATSADIADMFGIEVVDTGTCGDNVTYKLYANGLLYVSGTGYLCAGIYEIEDLTDPSKPRIKKIYFDNNIREIYAMCAINLTELEEIIFPQRGDFDLFTIGMAAFNGCTKLKSITIPHYTLDIGSEAFANCSAMAKAYIPKELINLGTDIFSGTGLTDMYYEGTQADWTVYQCSTKFALPTGCTVHYNYEY